MLGSFASGKEYLRGISRARGSMFTRYSCLQMHMCVSSEARVAETKNRITFFDSALANLMHRDSNYLSLSRPQTQLVQRAQWAQYPVEEIANGGHPEDARIANTSSIKFEKWLRLLELNLRNPKSLVRREVSYINYRDSRKRLLH